MKVLSIFKGFNIIEANKSFEEIAELIKNGTYKNQVDFLRNLIYEGNIIEYKTLKKKLPAFTPSGLFDGGRKTEFLKSYSGIIVLDIDNSNEQTLELKKIANSIKYTYCSFVSPGGNGLKIFVRVSTGIKSHLHAFNSLKSYYEKVLKVSIDPSGKDVTRLCFFSYDPDLYLNIDSEIFSTTITSDMESNVKKLINDIDMHRIDITSNYEDWCNIGFALENEFGESGRQFFHSISKHNPEYNNEICNDQYTKCLKNGSSGITIKTLFHIAKLQGLPLKPVSYSKEKLIIKDKSGSQIEFKEQKKITSNKFTITENYLNQRYIIRYNVVSNKFEYKANEDKKFREMNENNLYVRLQKDNINMSLNNLIALLKSDFVNEYNPFIDYFKNLPDVDGKTDYIKNLSAYLKTPDRERLDKHFKKWLVRVVRTAIDNRYYNKQAFILVSNKQNSGKSTFCRFLCPTVLQDFIIENIGTDKDSLIAITENLIINLDELSTADKTEINAFKSMFSKDKVKTRLTYDKRASVHVRRASFLGSTDRWDFLSDENGSVRWLCFDISFIDWNYSKNVNIDLVYAHAYYLLTKTNFDYELTAEEIEENDRINKKYQIGSTERDLIQQHLEPGTKENCNFYTATDILEYLIQFTSIKLSPEKIGKELKFLNFERTAKKIHGSSIYGYLVKFITLP